MRPGPSGSVDRRLVDARCWATHGPRRFAMNRCARESAAVESGHGRDPCEGA